jgi:hypothetical protein
MLKKQNNTTMIFNDYVIISQNSLRNENEGQYNRVGIDENNQKSLYLKAFLVFVLPICSPYNSHIYYLSYSQSRHMSDNGSLRSFL